MAREVLRSSADCSSLALDLRDDHRHDDIRALATKQRPNANRFRGIVTITKARAEPFYSLRVIL